MSVIAILGLCFVVVGFGCEMAKTIERGDCDMSRKVISFFILASAFLFYHALTLRDVVFMVLNPILAGVNAVNFYYA